MNKTRLRLQIGLLLDHCRECNKGPENNEHPDKVCGGCSNYEKIRKLGDKLAPAKDRFGRVIDGKKLKVNLTIEEYISFKRKGLKDYEIAEIKGINVYAWKHRNKEKLKNAISATN